MGDNLPSGVGPGDIDDHFGVPDRVRVLGTVKVGASAEVPKDATKQEKQQALLDAVADGEIDCALEAEIGEEEPPR